MLLQRANGKVKSFNFEMQTLGHIIWRQEAVPQNSIYILTTFTKTAAVSFFLFEVFLSKFFSMSTVICSSLLQKLLETTDKMQKNIGWCMFINFAYGK